MARIAVGGFRHETNTFSPTLATYDEFEKGYSWPPLTRGEGLFAAMQGYNLGLAGFIEEARVQGHELVPLTWASASPSGAVTRDAYERIAGMLLEDIAGQGPFDAIYLGLHGAMVAEHLEDGEGELLRRIRDIIGPDLPVVASLDYHSNTTPEMVRHATALIGYRTYPHIDMAETGRKVARHLDGLLSGTGAIQSAYRQVPFLIPLTWGCTMTEPATSVIRLLESPEGGGVASLTFTAGFPAADIWHCGPAVFGYGTDRAAIENAVNRLADEIERREAEWAGRLYDPDAAVQNAMEMARAASRPIIMADTQDNPGAGGTADTMGLLKALVRHGAEGASLGLVYDPHIATVAHRMGEGAEITVCLGGKHGIEGDTSFDATFTVERLTDGKFTCTGAFYGGARMDLAPMACLRIGGVRIVVCGKKVQAADQEMFRHVGIEPTTERILALKSSVHFRADFQPIAEAVLVVAAPGAMIADPSRLPFRKIRPGVRLSPSVEQEWANR